MSWVRLYPRFTAIESGSSLKYFSGDNADYKEYRRWKVWAINKMRTMDRLEKSSRGSFIWTLLQRRALEIVEQLKPEEYQIEGGEEVLFKLLDQRWPGKGRHDEMWETIAEVFCSSP